MKYVEESTKEYLKKAVKASATNALFEALKKKLMKHKKVKHIQYDLLEMQPYLRSEKAAERQTITALRSKCVWSVKTNFSTMYKKRLNCPLNWSQENQCLDTFHSEILASLNFDKNKMLSPGLENNHTLQCCSGNFPT